MNIKKAFENINAFPFLELGCYGRVRLCLAAEAAGDHVLGLYGPKEEEEKGDRKRMRKRTRG